MYTMQYTGPSTEGGRLRKRSHRYPEDDRRLRGDGGGGSHGPVAGAMAQAMAGHGGHAGHGAPTKKGGDRGGRPPKHQMTQKQMSFLQGKHQQRVGNVVSRLGPAAVGQASLMDKKRKLYSDTSQQPLWSLRKITINPTDKDDLRRFPSNAISTYRYTPMTFLVKNLWEQFHRVINWWFLLIAIIQAIPQLHYNPNHVWSTALPLSIVLVFGMVKDILTDIGRRRRDRLLNQRICCIVDGHTPQLRLLKWQSVHVGNILRLTDGEEVPADIVVLATSNADGVAYVETSKLDGETNLKFKQGVKETRGESSPLSIAGIRGRVVCEKPSAVMDAFTGSLKLDAHPRATPLDIVNFIQRGSHIRNTEWLYGVVIYTGEDTRIQKNAAPPGFKRPHIEKDINTYLFISFFVVFLTILISVMSKWSVQERDGGDNTSSDTSNSSGSGPPVADSAQTYGSSVEFMLGSRDLLQNPWTSILRFLALYAPLLPLSLPFVLDVIYLLQSILIQGDVHIRGGGRLGSSNGPSTGSTSSLTAPEEGGQDGETPEYLPHLSRSVMSRGVSLTKRLISRISSPGLQTASAVGGSSDPVSDPLAGGEQTTAAGQGGSNGESPTSPQQLTGSDTLPRRGTTPPPRGATGGSRSTESDAPSKHSRAVSDASTMHEGEPQPGLAANSVPSQPRLLPQHGAGDDVEPPGGGIVWMPTTGSNVTCFGAKRRTETEDVWPEVHCPALNPNLGQVDFVFTDKTGTITENDMTFSMCSVAGKIYGMTTYGGYDPGESSEYAGSASRGWTRQISSRGSRDRLLNAQQSQQTLSRGGTSLSSRSISLLSEGLAKRVPSLRMRKSPTHVQDDDEKGSTSVSATGSSSPSKPESFGAMASLSAESRPEKKPDASPDNHSPHNSAEGAVELPAAPTAKVATEAVHGAPLRQMMSGLARRGTSPRGEQPSAGSRTRKGSPAEDERRAERRPKDSSEDTSTKKKKKKKRKKLEVSDESSTGPISCIRSISDGYKREGPPRRTSTSDSEVPVFSSPISAQFSFPGVAQPGGEEEREPSPTQSSRPHITFADGVPTSLPESPVGGVSPRESSFGPTTSVPDTSGLPASSRVSPRHLGGDLGTSEGSLYMPAVEEEEEDDGFFGGGPPVPSGRGGDVPFLYDDIDFPTGFRETPMEGQIRKNCDFYDSSIFTDLSRRDWRSHRINEFIKCMAICNTVVPWVYSTTPSGYEGAGSSAAVSSLFSASSIAQCTSFAGLPGGECAGEGDHTGFAKHHPHGVLVHKSSGGQHGGTIGSGGAPTASAVSGFALCRASSRRRTRITRQEGAASVAGANGPWHVSTGQLETGGGGPSYIPSPRAHSPRGDGTTNSPADRPPAVASPTGGGEDGSSPTAPAPALPPSVLRGQQGAAGGGLRPAKSLARGVSFKEKHEEFSFSKDEDTMTQDDEAAGSGEEQESEQDEEGGGEHKRSGGGRDEEDDAEDGGKGGRPGIKGRKCRSTSVSLMSLKTKVTASSRDVADLLFRRSSRNHGTDSVGSLSNHITRSLGRTHSIDRTTSHSCYGLNGSSMGGGGLSGLVNIIKYQASSPDEECLVSAASHMGYTLVGRTSNSVTLSINGQERRWQVIGVNEFTQKRGRMSVVVKPQEWTSGSILYVKGADVAMLGLLSPTFTRPGNVFQRSASPLGRSLDPGRVSRKPTSQFSRNWSNSSLGGASHQLPSPTAHSQYGGTPVQGSQANLGEAEGSPSRCLSGRGPTPAAGTDEREEELRRRFVRADSMLKALNPALYNYDRQMQSSHFAEGGGNGSVLGQDGSSGSPCGEPSSAMSLVNGADGRLGSRGAADFVRPPQPQGACDGVDAYDDEEQDMAIFGQIALVEQHLKKFSLQGLRTMALACRYLSQEETETYKRLYNDACASVYCRAERLEEVAEDMERDLEYLGITGVRDKLQEMVPETLQLMMEAGIRVWMVTGDNVEYALHICHSCRLLTSRTRIFHAALEFSGRKAKREGVMLYELFRKARRLKRTDEHICLVVTGPNLRTFLNHPDLQTYFLNMACCSDVVVAARVTPSQKAEMVRLVKKRLTPQPITLAIGDGGNDVAMLQEAHVGVAIRGADSAAAVAAAYADYSFSEFRFLQRLLFVHGRLSLMRVSVAILWSFFKSLCIGLPAFLFQPQAFWSAVEVYDPLLLMLVDFLWTSLPGIIHGYSDQDLPTHLLPSVPVLYTPGRRRLYFNGFRFIFWTVEGIVYSFIIFYLLQATWMEGNTFSDGQVLGFHSYGVLMLFGSLLQSNVRIILETNLWTPTFLFTTIILCTVMFFPGQLVMALFFSAVLLYAATGWPRQYMELAGRVVFAWPMLYFLIPLWISIGILVQLLLHVFTSSLFPNISGAVKHYLAQKQADVDARRKATRLPFTHPRPRLLPGGHDEYGWMCGMGSCQSMLKRWAWFMGGCLCIKTPVPAEDTLGSQEFCSELRERFNPLRHKSVADRLPPPRRFRINENFLSYTSAADDKAGESAQRDSGGKGPGCGPAAAGLAGAGAAAAGRSKSVFSGAGAGGVMPMTDMTELETENSLSSNNSGRKPGDNNTKLVKVSHLINRFTLRFKDMQLEADYQIHNKKSFLKRLVPWYRVIFVFIALYQILSFLTEYFVDKHWNPRQTRMQGWMCLPTVVVELGFVAVVICTFYDFIFLDHFSLILNSIVFLMVASNFIFYAASHVDGTLTSVLFPVFTFVILRISFLQAVVWNVLFLMITILRFLVDHKYLPTLNFVHYLPLFIGVDVFVGFVGYRLEYNQRKSFLLDYSVDASRRKQREILNTMLPAFVVDQMINSELNEEGIPTSLKAEDRGTVSVIFCDVYEFQQVVASIEPTRLVEVLDSLFLCFDRSAEQFGCTKIETVFETYLAAAGLQPGKEASPATYKQDACDALDMALAMLEVAAQIRYEVKTSNPIGVGGHGALGGSGVGHGGPGKDAGHHPGALGGHMVGRQKTGNIVRTVLQSRPQRIRVKIGIHSGRVISGVVGAKKPQYALFGDTVNTASRMKTTGQPGYIHISEASYELVKDDDTLEYEPRHTEVKGKGLMNTYLLIRVKGSPYPHFDEQEGGSGDQLSDSGHPYGERRSVSRLSRRASTWSVVAGEAPTDEHGVAAGDMFAGDPAGAAGATAVAAAETLDPEAAGVANSEAQEAVLDDIVNRAVEDARVPLGSSEVEKRLQSGFRRADSGAHPGRLLSLRLSQRDSGLRPELKSFETIEEHGAAFDPKMGNRAEKRGPESSDAAGENRVRAFARRPGRGVHGRVGRDGLEEPHGEDWSDWADESEECDAKRQVESEDRGSRYCGARERVETGEVETEEEDPRIVAASTTGEGDTSSGASTTSREGAKLTPAGPGTLASLVKLEGETSMEVSRTRWKRTGVKRCTVPSRKSYEAVAVESAEVEPQWSRPGSLVRKAHTTRTGTGDRSRPSRFRTERPSKFEEVALGLLNRRKYVSEEDGDSTECQDQVRGAPVSARSRSVEKGNDPFDYTDVPVRQLVRIYQRQHRVGSVLSWVNEELRGRRPSSAPSTLALQDEQPGVGGPVSDGEDGISRGGDIRLLQRIKDALRRTPKTVGAEPSALEENSLDGTGDNSMEIPSAREGLGDMESRHCTGVTQQKLFSTDMSHGAAEEVEGEGESPGAEEPAMYEAAKAVHGDDANGQLLSRRNTKSFENDGSPAAHNKGDEEGRQLSTRHGTCPKSSGADRKGETSRRPGHHGAGSRVRTLMTFLYPQASRRTHSPDLQGTGMTAGAENEPGTEGRQPSNVDDEDLEQSRATRISVSSEWLLLKFKDKNLEARYRTHFYNNKSNINTIEQALIIFLLTFCVQTLTRLALPRVYNASPQLTVKLHVCSDLYWAVRATYTLAAFALWMLFHYRNRKEVATCLELRWMVFLLNLLFISASCVFALSNSWGVCAPGDSTSSTTSSQSQGTSETQTDQTFSVLYQDTGSVSNANTHGFVTRSLTDSSRTYTYWLLSDTIELFFYIVILHHNTGLLFQNCILVDVLLMTMSLTFITTTAKETAITVSTIATFPCYVFFNLVSAYCKEYIDRLTFYVNEHAKTTESRATQLLNDMLPKQVLEEFQQDKLKLAYLHEKVTFLFADICGFTSWAKGVDACEVVTMLQKLFAKFDKDSTKFGLYKLCTIGDAYVAVSEPVTAENAQDTDAREGMWLVLQMAKAMISNITEVRERLNIPNLNMRIGLHYGSCVGGVIGSGRLRYDLWGMDVLTGNMMESNGVPGKINVSDPLKTEIEKGFPGEFAFKFNKRVAVLESTVDSYLIRSSKELDEDEGWHIGGCIPAAAAGPVPAVGGPAGQGGGAMMRRDVTAVRGTYRRRFTILGNAPRVLVRRHSLKGNNVHGAGGPHGKRGQPAKGEATPAASLRYQRQHAGDQAGAFEDEDEGLRELRREIERAGGKR